MRQVALRERFLQENRGEYEKVACASTRSSKRIISNYDNACRGFESNGW